ncbi:TetR family transcriptional regulator C-terminal domain-containing protein [Streptomyces sp. NPDC006365]|uniref:TetR family transcriptional regulator C-terminal domain-containing protein n=1 Tax=Streptomyces sp. NPDC006365 TaxID=3364744 RepID=UPI0036861A04
MQAVMGSETPAADRLQHLVRAFASDLTKNPDRAPLALELLALARTIPDIRTCFDSHHEQFVEHIATLLAQMSSSGARKPDTHLAALAFASMIDGMVLRWTLARSPFDLESALWEATQVLLRGVATPQGL